MDSEDEYDILGGYLPTFVQHLNDSRARLGLRIDSQDSEDQIDVEREVEEDAEPHALSNWTSAEQDAFFRAVSVHSRWRPDLIAACVPTKTEWEVWMYLEALEEGAAALAVEEDNKAMDMEDGDVEMQVDESASDSRPDSGSDMNEDEDDEELCEPALEVGQDWIDAEERMATWIIDWEHFASLQGDAVTDTAEIDDKPPKRVRGRPHGSGKGGPRNRARPKRVTGSPPPILHSPSPTSTSRKRSRNPSIEPARRLEALMGHLEAPRLLVLDSILREGAEAMNDGSKSREGSVTATSTEDGDDGAPRTRDRDVSSLSDRITGSPGTGNVPEIPSNVVIDPVLLTLSRGADPAGRRSGQVPNESTSTRVPTQGLSSLANGSPQPTSPDVPSQPGADNMLMSSQDNVTDANAESELLLLSPRSRRRIQKRLYMRRKRALLRGDNIASGGVQDTGIAKLKPGKKVKPRRSETSPIAVPCSETPSDSEAELPENVPKKNKPGLTLPYKLKAQFTELGVDAAYLRDQGMDLLNLGALGRLMGLYASLAHDGEGSDESAITKSVSAQLIQHLQAGMVSFVTDVIHRAIVWREREIRLKRRNRAWRQGDQITTGAVEHAVEATGARYRSHKAYLKSLEARYGQSTEAEPNSSVDPDVRAAKLSAELPKLSTHRDMYTPLVCAPSAWKLSPLACLTRTYEQEATRTRRGASAEIDEDEMMSDETNEEALEEELALEDAVDELDMAVSARHEGELWGKIKK